MCISTCVDKTPPMPTRPRNASQHVLTKPLLAFEDTKCITTRVYQTDPKPERTQNASQNVLSKYISCQQRHKKYLNVC
jgi:hypothetical protein